LRILAEESDARPVVRHAHTLVIDAGADLDDQPRRGRSQHPVEGVVHGVLHGGVIAAAILCHYYADGRRRCGMETSQGGEGQNRDLHRDWASLGFSVPAGGPRRAKKELARKRALAG
jgi:hypothetical protein